MILDKLLQFDDNVAITVTRASTNILDLLQDRDLGIGGHVLSILCEVGTAFTAGGAATLVTAIQGAIDDGTGNPGTWYDLVDTPAVAVAALTAGAEVLRVPLPLNQPANPNATNTPPRFLRLNYTVATGPMTAGTIKAYLIDHAGRQANYQYPSGFNAAN